MSMVRTGLWRTRRNSFISICICSTFLCLAFFFMLSRNLSQSGDNVLLYEGLSSMDPELRMSYSKRRTELYEKMSRELDEHGPTFLSGGVTSQSLSLSDIFTVKDGLVTPVLKAADPPVRANVLYLDPKFSRPISQVVKSVFLPHFDKAIWFQNENLYHFSMFHASHHLEPIPASANEVDAEASAIEVVSRALCPLRIILERVVMTSTGVLLGCWQVLNGTDPAIIRSELRIALPHAPKKQLYDPVMLHTSFARLLGHPQNTDRAINASNDMLAFFHELVSRVNRNLHGFEMAEKLNFFMRQVDSLIASQELEKEECIKFLSRGRVFNFIEFYYLLHSNNFVILNSKLNGDGFGGNKLNSNTITSLEDFT